VTVLIKAPVDIGLGHKTTHKNVVRLVRQLRENVLRKNRRVSLDFSGVTHLYADGMLLVYAELFRMLKRRPGSVTCCRRAEVSLVDEALVHLGVYALLGKKTAVTPTHPDAVNWHFASGELANGEAIGKVLEKFVPRAGKIISRLYAGIEEALSNVPQHAYDSPREDGTGIEGEKGWWMFVREDPDDLGLIWWTDKSGCERHLALEA
jgi:hypothetical protein